MTKIQTLGTGSVGKGVEKGVLAHTASGCENWYALCGLQFGDICQIFK